MATDNRTLGNFRLDGIAAAPRGMPQVDVTFDLDANGILKVSAKDKGTGKEQTITIDRNAYGLDESEIERMKRDAESHADDDKKRREMVDLKNQADQLSYQVEKTLKDHGEDASEEEKKAIESAQADLKQALESEDTDRIKSTMETLSKAAEPMAKRMYEKEQQQQQSQAQGEAGPQPDAAGAGATQQGGGDDDIIDADFEVKN